MRKGHINLHRGLRPGELSSRYRRLRHEPMLEHDGDPYDDYYGDDYRDGWDGASALDFELHRIWQDTLALATTPTLGLDAILGVAGAAGDRDAAVSSAITANEL